MTGFLSAALVGVVINKKCNALINNVLSQSDDLLETTPTKAEKKILTVEF
jgi:hypothetical protein